MIKLMKKMFILFLAVCFPWLLFLMDDNPSAAFTSLIMQVTVIGWPFATIWAWRTHYHPQEEGTKKP